MDCNGRNKISLSDIAHWKNPSLTIAFLVVLDVAYIVFKSLHVSMISSLAHKVFLLAIFAMIKKHLIGKSQECEMSKECVEKMYYKIYDCTNKALDKLRKVILLHEVPSLIRLLVSLIFIVTFGTYFSTLSLIVIGINLYIISNFGTIKQQIRNYSTIAIELTSKILSDNIPKYQEEQ